MKKIASTLFAFIFVIFLAQSTHAKVNLSQGGDIDFEKIDIVISEQMEKHGLKGVELAVIQNGDVVYLNAYGVDGNNESLTPQTRMFIGSQSKSFTALAVAQLAEEGKIELDASVQTYIPWFRVSDEEASKKITVNHLLHHTSGLSDSGFNIVLPLDTSSEEAVRSLSKAKLTAPVGTTFQYFNLGYAVLEYLVSLQSGLSYADYVNENILLPLGMTASTANPSIANDMPRGYSRFFGFAVPMKEGFPIYGVGGGWIVSNAEDMAKFAIEFQTNNNKLVSDKMMKTLLTPGIGSYGMDWFIYDDGQKIMHGGANQTFRTEVNLYPIQDRAFVLLINEGYQVDHFISASQLTNRVEDVVMGYPIEPASEGISVRWIGWAVGIFVIGLCIFHTFNFLALRQWREKTKDYSEGKKFWNVAISFIIPIVITLLVFWQVGQFYGNRFSLVPSLVYMSRGMPDVFVLMIVGTIPDLIQGVLKTIWSLRK